MAEIKDFPWQPGMLAVWADTGDWVRVLSVGDDGAIHWSEGDPAEGVDPNLEHAAPDWTDPATVGALSGVVRSLYNEPRLSAIYIDWTPLSDDKGWTLGWYEFHSGCGALVFVTCLGRMDPAPTEPAAWLAAYHAHRDAAGTTANDIEVIRG